MERVQVSFDNYSGNTVGWFKERHTPPTSRFWMGVPETAMAEETAVATMVENFIVDVVRKSEAEFLNGAFAVLV